MEDDKQIITTEKLITLEKLVRRWKGASDNEIIKLEIKGIIQAYGLEKSLQGPDKNIIHFLYKKHLPLGYDDLKDKYYIKFHTPNCLFILSDIIKIEKKFPSFLYNKVYVNFNDDNPHTHILTTLDQLSYDYKNREKEQLNKEDISQNFSQDNSNKYNNLGTFFEQFPTIHKVYELYCEGKTKEEIVEHLKANNIATNLQAGWLTKDDLSFQSDGAIKQKVKRMK